MANNNELPELFIVDGSNIATEGRDKPSLEQLTEAVEAFQSEYPNHKLTVVVDATFGHRIAKKEVKAFDQAIANNEIVTPPAGAVGRGDAFILAIAHKARAGVLSNDSFQEFHGEYGWLFDHGRLIGGKPVPHVGWVFVDRNPVRGPKSRESIKAARRAKSDGSPTDAKEQAKRRVRKKGAAKRGADAPAPEPSEQEEPQDQQRSEAPKSTDHVNELMPFLEFVEQYPIGSQVSGVVDSYSSHGAYAKVGDVLVYLPLRLMSDPPPTSARKVLTLGDPVEVVIERFVPDRRSVDAALPPMASTDDAPDTDDGGATEPGSDEPAAPSASSTRSSRSSRRRKAKAAAKQQAAESDQPGDEATAESDATDAPPADDAPPPKKKAAARKRGAKKSAAKKAPAKKRAAKKPAAKKSAAKKSAAKKAPAKKSAAKKTAAKKAPAKKAAAKKPAAKRAPAKKRAAKKRAAKQAAAPSPESTDT